MEFSSGQGKSYTCAFCQRGFSNAQALGGHMNIHRRDRAKLRQSFEENLLSMENSSSMKSITDDDHDSHHPLEEKVFFGLEYSGDQQQKHISSTSSSNYKKYKDDHAIIQRGKVIGTSELVGMPRSKNEVRFESVEEKKNDDVDLELRLGLEPQQEEPNLSTREFF